METNTFPGLITFWQGMHFLAASYREYRLTLFEMIGGEIMFMVETVPKVKLWRCSAESMFVMAHVKQCFVNLQ